MHARRKHGALLEWGMWLVWRIAEITVTSGRRVAHVWHRHATPRLSQLITELHRATLRVDMVIDDLCAARFTGSASRLRRRVPYVILGIVFLGDLLWLYAR